MDLRKLLTKFNDVPVPYYVGHALFALLIAVVAWPIIGLQAGLLAGMFFYIGREFTQWESGLPLDWKGLLAPVLVNGTILLSLALL